MKFGKRLKRQIEETLPEWRDKFLSYKELKKLLRLMHASPEGGAEADFLRLLVSEVGKFNVFFVEQEEDFVIRHKELQERIRDVVETVGPAGRRPSERVCRREMVEIRRGIVNLHGEMVLLENYSNVNYTGLAKILKKYDKRTGRLLRLPFIEKVLKQPFFITDLVSGLVKDLESTMDAVFPAEPSDAQLRCTDIMRVEEKIKERKRERVLVGLTDPGILRNTVAALATMRDLRRGSSTYGHFSLPPLDTKDGDERQPMQPASPIRIL